MDFFSFFVYMTRQKEEKEKRGKEERKERKKKKKKKKKSWVGLSTSSKFKFAFNNKFISVSSIKIAEVISITCITKSIFGSLDLECLFDPTFSSFVLLSSPFVFLSYPFLLLAHSPDFFSP